MERYPHGVDSYQNRDNINKDYVGAKLESIGANYRRAVVEAAEFFSHFSVFVKKFGEALLLPKVFPVE